LSQARGSAAPASDSPSLPRFCDATGWISPGKLNVIPSEILNGVGVTTLEVAMLRLTGLLWRAVALVVTALLLVPLVPAAHAADDPCPESNDTFQVACFLGQDDDAIGYLATPNDVDAYRIEVLDFNAKARIRLVERPLPYQIELADWNGQVIASGPNGTIETTLSQPGAYYIFVHPSDGRASATAAYRLNRELQYPSGKTPDILYSNELRFGAEPEARIDTGAEYSSEGGRFTIKMTAPGTPDSAQAALSMWGPELSDFTLTIDSRMQSEGVSGYHIFFRFDDGIGYVLLVTAERLVALGKAGNGAQQILSVATPKSLDLNGGVNRTTIHCTGDLIRIWINGEEIIRGRDATRLKGRFGFGAVTTGAPPTVIFDNIIATTPAAI
jgi:hypothetical protein